MVASLIARGRFKRWTNIPFFGAKSDDVLCVKLPKGAKLRSVHLGEMRYNAKDPNDSTAPGSQVGNFWTGSRLVRVVQSDEAIAVCTHWWFNAFSDAEYSISVWVDGPKPYPEELSESIQSVNMDDTILSENGAWLEGNGDKVQEGAADLGLLFNGDVGALQNCTKLFLQRAVMFTKVPHK